jgi:hypothetical protein
MILSSPLRNKSSTPQKALQTTLSAVKPVAKSVRLLAEEAVEAAVVVVAAAEEAEEVDPPVTVRCLTLSVQPAARIPKYLSVQVATETSSAQTVSEANEVAAAAVVVAAIAGSQR